MWTVSFKQDTAEPGVGTATATDGSATVTRRLDTNSGDDIGAFLAECEAAAAAAQKMAGDSAAVIAKVEAVLNGGK